MKNVKRILCMLLSFCMLIAIIPTITTEAKTTKQEPAYQGKWTYFSVDNMIYKLNSKDGTTKKVKKLNKVFDISDISYYNGYLYFTSNYYIGTDSTDCYICRMKTDGSGFTKLDRGASPLIWNKKIYYIKSKHITEGYYEYDQNVGIATMSLNGKNSKILIKNKDDSLRWSLLAANGKLYYMKYSKASQKTAVMSYDIRHKKSSPVYKTSSALTLYCNDAAYIYFTVSDLSQNHTLYAYNVKTGKQTSKKLTSDVNLLAAKNGTVYYYSYDTNTTYSYNVQNKKTKTVLKNHYLVNLTLSKYQYQVVDYDYTQEEFEACNYKYDRAKSRMKLNGKGFKRLIKYYVS